MAFFWQTNVRYLLLFLVLFLTGCMPGDGQTVVVTRVVAITREVAVTREVEVTREIVVEKEIEVTREVTVVVGEEASPAPDAPEDGLDGEEAPGSGPARPLATTVAGVDGAPDGTGCWSWQQAASRVGRSGCVEGTVTGVGQSPNAFFINFSDEHDSFYGVSFDWSWEEITGDCLRIEGTITEYRGRPQMVIEEPSRQVKYCGSGDAPPAFRQ